MTDRFVDELIAQRDALAARLTEVEAQVNGYRSAVFERDARLTEAEAEIARLRFVMINMAKYHASHIIEHAVYPSPDEYRMAKAHDIHLGPTITYTCGIHNLAMGPHGDRCPECDKTP